ncbi:UbiX family flavin prenyltransferase [Streptomyces huiliensis]|uniref:UbiX family flavin prenyltransferase n=1 Tax=Streptomyces huiliensis TaxID=2876027 RepID=UPI001CBCB816|nr:UbiX family flavin prenyltransferase [Streptomyces huiliensis]MBZ4317852.1 UbiX family flavin prenyltransferase [Streptomyces huiliensis]
MRTEPGGGAPARKRIVVGLTGATGAIYGIRLLQALAAVPEAETHLVLSRWARTTIGLETEWSAGEVAALADVCHASDDLGATVASGSFPTDGMVIAPCSMKTLAAVRTGYSEGLVARVADVTLKERRRLVLVPRETPLSEVHLENMLSLCRMGAVIMPPAPAFYNRPRTLDEIVDHLVSRVLDQFGLETSAHRWEGMRAARLRATS